MSVFTSRDIATLATQRANDFNYGQPLPPPYGERYDAVERESHALRAKAGQLAQRSWRLDMALRDVRLAETEAEREAAIRGLGPALVEPDANCHVTVDVHLEYDLQRFADDGGPCPE